MSLSAQHRTVRLMGVNLFALRMSEVVDICNDHIANRQRLLIGMVNAAKIVNAGKDAELRAALEEADIVLADGAPVVWLSKMVGRPLPERVAGIDLMYRLLKEADVRGYAVYFLGAKPEVVRKVVEVIRRDYPGLRVAGHRDGYFDRNGEQGIAEEIRDSGADILFVAISPPKKEIFLRDWREFMNVPICHGVGGSFDVVAGVAKRAPAWMQKCGLEWLHRLIQEPRRMWKRYLVTNTKFVLLSIGEVTKSIFCRILGRSGRGGAEKPADVT